jgi:hypothetical protein
VITAALKRLRDTAIMNTPAAWVARGFVAYFRHPQQRDTLGGILNGQLFRRTIVDQLISVSQCGVIVETGTHKGVTTEYFASFGIPVYSVEVQPFYCGMARARLLRYRNVRLAREDSPRFLKRLARSGMLGGKIVFFYLDAHWQGHVPLADEIEAIGELTGSVIMIDDFHVGDDPCYGFDDYGPGRTLDWSYIKPLAARHHLRGFVPTLPGDQETGYRRGCVVLCADTGLVEKLKRLDVLRPAVWEEGSD